MPDDNQAQPPDPVSVSQALGNNQQPPDLGSPQTQAPTLAPQPVKRPMSGGPLLGQMLAEVFKQPTQMQSPGPGQIATDRPVSRAGDYESFLSQFLYSLGQGFANEGRGPGAAYRGAGAAITAPIQLQMQQQALQAQVGQQQAQAQQAQAEAGLKQAQAQPVNIPGVGNIPAASVGGYFGMQGRIGAAQIAGQAGIQRADIQAQNRLLTTAMLNPALPLDPTLAAAAGHPEWANQLIGKPQLEALTKEINTKTTLVGKASTGEQIREDADGNLVKIPVTTISRPNLPIGPQGATPNRIPQPGAPINQPTTAPSGLPIVGRGKGSTQMMVGTDADGSIVAGTPQELRAAGINSFTKMDANEASKVTISRQLIAPNGLFSLVNQDLQRLGANNLGPIASRWNDFMSGKVGTGPQFASLRTDMGLLGTALMQAHMGSRGGEGAIEHFTNLADYRIADAPTLRSALAAEYRYVNEKAARPKPKVQ